MEVEVSLYPPLRENRFSKATVTLVTPATVETLLEHLGLKETEVESVYINGRAAGFKQTLLNGDRVSFLPLIGGG